MSAARNRLMFSKLIGLNDSPTQGTAGVVVGYCCEENINIAALFWNVSPIKVNKQ